MKKQLREKEIKALISLLDDNDNEVVSHIKDQLFALGKEIIPALENEWSHSFDPLLQARIEDVIHKIQFDSLCSDLQIWNNTHHYDLLSGIILIARYQYPDLDEDKIRNFLSQLKRDIWIELNDNLTALEQVNIINRIMFDVYAFGGNTVNFHAPQNSFINSVIESKKGNPILLSIIYSLVAQELDIPIYGVNLPEHFILCYQDRVASEHYQYTFPDANILFYINPFSRGTVFGKDEVDKFLSRLKINNLKDFYIPCSNRDMIRRILRNLHYSYTQLGDSEKAPEVAEMQKIFETED